MNYLGIDFGKKKIGIAIALEGRLATGLFIMPNVQEFFSALGKLIEENDIQSLVVGTPVSLNGQESDSTRSALEFTARLRENFPAQHIYSYNERLTTQEAKRNLPSRKPDDAEAARIILQGFLDKQKMENNKLH